MQITSGQGPDECCWVAARVVEQVLKEALDDGFRARVLETVASSKYDLFKSALIAIDGDGLSKFINKWQGTIQWIGKSTFRPKHKRKNWFVGASFYHIPETTEINTGDLKFETMRSSGPGGQHANKTESAVRVTHIPTGIAAFAQEERSQHLNRKLALSRLLEKLNQDNKASEQNQQKHRWANHAELERGNPIRVYEGPDFKLKSEIRI